MVLDRAVDTEGYPSYTLLELLQGLLRVGINPQEWDTMRDLIVGSADVLLG